VTGLRFTEASRLWRCPAF